MSVSVNDAESSPVTDSKAALDAKSTGGTRSNLLADQLSGASASHKTAQTTSPTKGGSETVRCSAFRKKACAKHGSESVKKSEKSGRRNTAIPSHGKSEVKIQAPTTAPTSSGLGVSSAAAVAQDNLSHDEGALTVLPLSSSDLEGAFN